MSKLNNKHHNIQKHANKIYSYGYDGFNVFRHVDFKERGIFLTKLHKGILGHYDIHNGGESYSWNPAEYRKVLNDYLGIK